MTFPKQNGQHKMSATPSSSHLQPAPQGTILGVEHIPTTHGEKIHTRILLKGHPLPTLWRGADIHLTCAPELHWDADRCLYCQQCDQVCPKGCLHQGDAGLEIDRIHCDTCGDCVKECPSKALEMIGLRTTAGELLHKTLKQNYPTARKICQMTICGGEPGWQSAFCADLLFQIAAAGIPSRLDTSGQAAFEGLLPLLAIPDQINFDLVSPNRDTHLQITGQDNHLILENLLKVCQEITPPTSLQVRTPLIRSQTATEAEITRTGNWLAEHLLPHCLHWQLFESQPFGSQTDAFQQEEWQQFGRWAKSAGFSAHNISMCDRAGQPIT